MKRPVAIITGLVGVSVGLSAARGQGFGDLNSRFGFSYADSDVPADVNHVTGQQTSLDGQSVRLYGDFGPIDGARFGSGFVLYWSGGFGGPIHPGDRFVVDVDFLVQVTGGNLAWSFFANMFSVQGFEHARIQTGLMEMPPLGAVSGAHFESSPFTQPGDSANYEGYLHIEWTGFGPTDTLSLLVPQGSIDATYVPVPEPCSAWLAFVAFAFLRFRLIRVGRSP